MNLTLVTDANPDDEPLSLAEAKAYLRVDSADDDGSIQGLIVAARLEAENENGRECAKKQWILALDNFPSSGYCGGGFTFLYAGRPYVIGLGYSTITLLDPIISVDTFRYRKADGTWVVLVADTDYVVDARKHPGIVCPAYGTQWPSGDLWPSSAIELTFTAGFCADNPAPATIKQGIQLLVSQWFESRIPFEEVRFIAEMPFSVTSLFRNNRLWKF